VAIDYAHTDAALAAALRSYREATGRRLLLVFGCGGDRDPGKRPLMGRAAGELADLPIATSDNPRSEDPLHILQGVEQGLKLSGNPDYRIVPDRREAIRRALQVAASSPEQWAVLVAGKGHEQAQIVGERRIPFSDREEIRAGLAALGWSAAEPDA
jgi:UDP-N-acetylmuramoyl-L-alanyl-D-glutamate--2,6-diaminopimelate ligase